MGIALTKPAEGGEEEEIGNGLTHTLQPVRGDRSSMEDACISSNEEASTVMRETLPTTSLESMLQQHMAPNHEKNAAVVCAASQYDWDRVENLVKDGASINARDDDGKTALMWAASDSGSERVEILIWLGADVQAKDNVGNTALLEAACCGNLDVVRYFVKKRVDEEVVNSLGETALIRAAMYGHINVVQHLVKHGADINAEDNSGETALMKAAMRDHLKVVEYLMKQPVISVYALRQFIQDGKVKPATLLLNQGVTAAHLDDNENSTLMILLQNNNNNEEEVQPLAELLLENGAPPRQLNNRRESALDFARIKRFYNIVEIIIDYSVNQTQGSEEGLRWPIRIDEINFTRIPIGEGSFGVVYRGIWMDMDVAVKMVERQAQNQARVQREVQLWSICRHKNVVQYLGANLLEPPYFIVSSFASNGTLPEYLSKNDGAPDVWQKLLEVATGLRGLHRMRIIHGDLKGNNILVGADSTAMLSDFGLSFHDGDSPQLFDQLAMTWWRAPEYAGLGTRPSFASDVFSLGMCIIEAVTIAHLRSEGHDPASITESLTRNGIIRARPVLMTDAQWALVERMTDNDPTSRPTLHEVHHELKIFANSESGILTPVG